ncbi:hypothetical protein FA10DRAFT_300693 [Acaromyces ingoldii]|uniref:Uncharacterized protein n=1 Tax=Acaromyces ingoldii TaxID=215250 RepID=A0A316YU21_9BASI|nr:hypothetical protein FA10DRAFT_300693 [Acaromyces ingoldii]PWN92168.1 hypothetical protein FA10DRAFT_300693 [Acaromyces ingoldii]
MSAAAAAAAPMLESTEPPADGGKPSSTTPTFTLSFLALTTFALVGTAWRATRLARSYRADQQAWKSVAMRLLVQHKEMPAVMPPPRHYGRHRRGQPFSRDERSVEELSSPAFSEQYLDQQHKRHCNWEEHEKVREWNKWRREASERVESRDRDAAGAALPQRRYDLSGNLIKEILPVSKKLLPDGMTGIDARIKADEADVESPHPHHDWNWTPADHPRIPKGRPSRRSFAQSSTQQNARGRRERMADSVGWTSKNADGALWASAGSPSADPEPRRVEEPWKGILQESSSEQFVQDSEGEMVNEGFKADEVANPEMDPKRKNADDDLELLASIVHQEAGQPDVVEKHTTERKAAAVASATKDDADREERLMASILWPDAVLSADKTIIAEGILDEVAEKRAGAVDERRGTAEGLRPAQSALEQRSGLPKDKKDEVLELLEKEVADAKGRMASLESGFEGLQKRDEHRLRSESEAEARVEALERQIWALRARLDEADTKARYQDHDEGSDNDASFFNKKQTTARDLLRRRFRMHSHFFF